MELRPLTEADWELTLAWRNDKEISQGFYTQGLTNHNITWEEHIAWIKSRNQDWRTFIVIHEGHRIGVVTIDQLDHWSPEMGWYIGEKTLWGKGLGREAVRLGLLFIKNYGRQYARTTIVDNNARSIRLAVSLGFYMTEMSRPGESWYVINLKNF